MMIWERAKNALTALGIPMAQNVYLAGSGDYPDQYLVYSLIASTPVSHADDIERTRSYLVQVSIYDRNGLAGLPNIAGAMTAAGFTRGPEREIPYAADTRHFGLAMDFYYLED